MRKQNISSTCCSLRCDLGQIHRARTHRVQLSSALACKQKLAMNNSANNRFPPRSQPNTSGVQRPNRDQRRMADYIGQKEFHRPGGWTDNREEEYPQRAPAANQQRAQRNQRRARTWRKPRPPKVPESTDVKEPTTTTTGTETDKYQSTTTTAPKDDPLYNCTQGSRQFIKRDDDADVARMSWKVRDIFYTSVTRAGLRADTMRNELKKKNIMKLLGRAVGKEKRQRKLEEQRRRQQEHDKKHIEYIPIAHCSRIPGFDHSHLYERSIPSSMVQYFGLTYSNHAYPAHTHTHTYSIHSSTSNSRRIISSAISSDAQLLACFAARQHRSRARRHLCSCVVSHESLFRRHASATTTNSGMHFKARCWPESDLRHIPVHAVQILLSACAYQSKSGSHGWDCPRLYVYTHKLAYTTPGGTDSAALWCRAIERKKGKKYKMGLSEHMYQPTLTREEMARMPPCRLTKCVMTTTADPSITLQDEQRQTGKITPSSPRSNNSTTESSKSMGGGSGGSDESPRDTASTKSEELEVPVNVSTLPMPQSTITRVPTAARDHVDSAAKLNNNLNGSGGEDPSVEKQLRAAGGEGHNGLGAAAGGGEDDEEERVDLNDIPFIVNCLLWSLINR
ncbi:unnamed protein product [Trichogramma brassicae]|uniref:Uncharacterized protein n=1 Tax=Trichogramma brassicae TaxID=86971 RepID=A0A6H5I9D9_9HYME|nr:unnamed protein product [Trichogramma brassicae]